MTKLICYGSNIATNGIKARAPSAHDPTVIMLTGWELVFRCGYATIKPKEDGVVPCVVWTIDDDELGAVDFYEGHPEFYTRHDTEYGCVYIMAKPYSDKLIYPTVEYIKSIIDGYSEFGIDREFYIKADEEFGRAMNQ